LLNAYSSPSAISTTKAKTKNLIGLDRAGRGWLSYNMLVYILIAYHLYKFIANILLLLNKS